MDPEIPTISIVDLGIVTKIASESPEKAFVQLTPTFSGCPALKIMEQLVKDALTDAGYQQITVETAFETQWNTNMISENGRAALLQHGLAPPPKHEIPKPKQVPMTQIRMIPTSRITFKNMGYILAV